MNTAPTDIDGIITIIIGAAHDSHPSSTVVVAVAALPGARASEICVYLNGIHTNELRRERARPHEYLASAPTDAISHAGTISCSATTGHVSLSGFPKNRQRRPSHRTVSVHTSRPSANRSTVIMLWRHCGHNFGSDVCDVGDVVSIESPPPPPSRPG